MKKTAIYPGSFDPITKGHLDVLNKASKMFDRVIIAVLKNDAKKGLLPTQDRVELIKDALKEMNLDNVEVDSFDLAPNITTVFLITKPKYNFISSSTVKEIAKYGGDISKFVPESVVKYFNKI